MSQVPFIVHARVHARVSAVPEPYPRRNRHRSRATAERNCVPAVMAMSVQRPMPNSQARRP
eukprot:scaffold478602_cov15-Prasinocladus_malaysianus.AAC.1